ncbi:hypothetical protein LEJE111609_09680 [Lelliottia jeotgali]
MVHFALHLFPVVRPWLNIPCFFLTNSWRKCARLFPLISQWMILSPPASVRYAAAFA